MNRFVKSFHSSLKEAFGDDFSFSDPSVYRMLDDEDEMDLLDDEDLDLLKNFGEKCSSIKKEDEKSLQEAPTFDKNTGYNAKNVYSDDYKGRLSGLYADAFANLQAAKNAFKDAIEDFQADNNSEMPENSQIMRMYANLNNALKAYGDFNFTSYENN